jgi:hypothetical protein
MTVNFDRVASPYRWLEYASFGPYLGRCRRAQLPHLAASRRALILGDGDGRFTARLLRSNPSLSADVVDSSSAMLHLLQSRIRATAAWQQHRIRLCHADALEWSPAGSYDLVVTHFFLDCLFPGQLTLLMDRLLPHLEQGTQWIVSEFAVLPAGPGFYLSAGLVSALYQAFGLLTGLAVRKLPEYASLFESRGFELARETSFLGGLLRSQLWSLP